jgi:hypothetical protein
MAAWVMQAMFCMQQLSVIGMWCERVLSHNRQLVKYC